jgi:hypothetical protein
VLVNFQRVPKASSAEGPLYPDTFGINDTPTESHGPTVRHLLAIALKLHMVHLTRSRLSRLEQTA